MVLRAFFRRPKLLSIMLSVLGVLDQNSHVVKIKIITSSCLVVDTLWFLMVVYL